MIIGKGFLSGGWSVEAVEAGTDASFVVGDDFTDGRV